MSLVLSRLLASMRTRIEAAAIPAGAGTAFVVAPDSGDVMGWIKEQADAGKVAVELFYNEQVASEEYLGNIRYDMEVGAILTFTTPASGRVDDKAAVVAAALYHVYDDKDDPLANQWPDGDGPVALKTSVRSFYEFPGVNLDTGTASVSHTFTVTYMHERGDAEAVIL